MVMLLVLYNKVVEVTKMTTISDAALRLNAREKKREEKRAVKKRENPKLIPFSRSGWGRKNPLEAECVRMKGLRAGFGEEEDDDWGGGRGGRVDGRVSKG